MCKVYELTKHVIRMQSDPLHLFFKKKHLNSWSYDILKKYVYFLLSKNQMIIKKRAYKCLYIWSRFLKKASGLINFDIRIIPVNFSYLALSTLTGTFNSFPFVF